METLIKIINDIYGFDLFYLIVTILSLIKCSRKGFVLSILAASKWLLAYVLTLFSFPKIKPYLRDVIDNEYVLDIILGVSIFVIIIFIILLVNKGISKAVSYSGIGNVDKFFGFLFGFVRSYVIVVCIFTTINIIYDHKKWPINLNKSYTFPIVEIGSNYLIKEFPDKKQYEKTKDKVQEL